MERIVLYTERKAINQPLRSQSGYSTFDQPLDRYDASTSTTVSTEITPRPPPSRLSVVVISVVTVVTSVMMTVSLPVFSGTMNSVGGDTFVVLFYGTAWTPVVCFAMLLIYKVSVNRTLSLLPSSGWRVLVLMGLTNALNGVFVVFSSSPSRTAPYLQGILSTSLIPFTVACRFLLLRKGFKFCSHCSIRSAKATMKFPCQRSEEEAPLWGGSILAAIPSVQNIDGDEVAETELIPLHGLQQCKEQRSRALVWLLSFLCALCHAEMRIVLPIVSSTFHAIHSDDYTLLLYTGLCFPVFSGTVMLLCTWVGHSNAALVPPTAKRILVTLGLLWTFTGVCSTFGSHPLRTPPYLQGILMTTRIPFTIVIRRIVLKKGISLRRLGCTIAVLIGLFITIEPLIWSLPGSGNDTSSGGSSSARIIWPMIFVLGFLPAAINVVICERELKKEEVHSVTFFTWCMVTQVVSIMSLFWVDFLPFFGMASSLNDFKEHLHNGFKCNFSSSPSCNNLPLKAWAFIAGFCLANISQFLLIQKAEGAIYAVVVQSMVTPIASLFWTFFKYEVSNDRFYWDPEFTETTVFTLGGLVIIVPAVVLYNIFSIDDAKESELKRLQDRTNDTTILRL